MLPIALFLAALKYYGSGHKTVIGLD